MQTVPGRSSMNTGASAAFSQGMPEYRLTSDLAQYSLPSANRDETRRLAWANSICLVFLGIAIIDLWQPVFQIRAVSPPAEPMAVIILPPVNDPEPLVNTPDDKPDEEPLDDAPAPILTPVLVAAPTDVSFSVP